MDTWKINDFAEMLNFKWETFERLTIGFWRIKYNNFISSILYLSTIYRNGIDIFDLVYIIVLVKKIRNFFYWISKWHWFFFIYELWVKLIFEIDEFVSEIIRFNWNLIHFKLNIIFIKIIRKCLLTKIKLCFEN